MSVIEKLEARAERLRAQLAKMWNNDPTVVAAATVDFARIIEDFGEGLIREGHARALLRRAYDDLTLPDESKETPGKDINLPAKDARSVPGHGQFYRRLRPRVWVAIDWTESCDYAGARE